MRKKIIFKHNRNNQKANQSKMKSHTVRHVLVLGSAFNAGHFASDNSFNLLGEKERKTKIHFLNVMPHVNHAQIKNTALHFNIQSRQQTNQKNKQKKQAKKNNKNMRIIENEQNNKHTLNSTTHLPKMSCGSWKVRKLRIVAEIQFF